ncbi:MAG: hypothetical protein M1826_002077 [Phylliscum demangeonii]|nr:MAG: hypothetical protein M1826_002077 [Phylliscum demangeonii]
MQLLATLGLVAAAATGLLPTGQALGINCRGGRGCDLLPVVSGARCAIDLVRYMEKIDPQRWYRAGEHIACCDEYCAFLQDIDGGWGGKIKELAHYIPDHGCRMCGSVPFHFPAENDVKFGQLTFNKVKSHHWSCENALCA